MPHSSLNFPLTKVFSPESKGGERNFSSPFVRATIVDACVHGAAHMGHDLLVEVHG